MDVANLDDMEDYEEEPKKKSRWKRNLLIFIIVTPLLFGVYLYGNNKNFKKKVNTRLTKMPGFIGEYFRNNPTEAEKNEKIDYLSNYYIGLDSEAAADKIYIIKKEDEKLYVDLIRNMNAISSTKTEDIVLKIRNLELRKDLLISVYDQAKEDEEDMFFKEVARIERQDLSNTIMEIDRRFTDRNFIKVLGEVRDNKMGEILYYVDYDIRNHILNSFDNSKRISIENMIYEKAREESTLIDIAKLYETKPVDVILPVIGNTDNYSIEKLGVIYNNMSVVKSAELLSNIDDEEFIENILTAIKTEEKLKKLNTGTTRDISKAMEFFNDYTGKINNLVKVYEKMTPSKIADIVEKMIANEETISYFEFSSQENYNISDNKIIIDVLSKMRNQTLSKVLDTMDADIASKVTQALAKPKEIIEEVKLEDEGQLN